MGNKHAAAAPAPAAASASPADRAGPPLLLPPPSPSPALPPSPGTSTSTAFPARPSSSSSTGRGPHQAPPTTTAAATTTTFVSTSVRLVSSSATTTKSRLGHRLSFSWRKSKSIITRSSDDSARSLPVPLPPPVPVLSQAPPAQPPPSPSQQAAPAQEAQVLPAFQRFSDQTQLAQDPSAPSLAPPVATEATGLPGILRRASFDPSLSLSARPLPGAAAGTSTALVQQALYEPTNGTGSAGADAGSASVRLSGSLEQLRSNSLRQPSTFDSSKTWYRASIALAYSSSPAGPPATARFADHQQPPPPYTNAHPHTGRQRAESASNYLGSGEAASASAANYFGFSPYRLREPTPPSDNSHSRASSALLHGFAAEVSSVRSHSTATVTTTAALRSQFYTAAAPSAPPPGAEQAAAVEPQPPRVDSRNDARTPLEASASERSKPKGPRARLPRLIPRPRSRSRSSQVKAQESQVEAEAAQLDPEPEPVAFYAVPDDEEEKYGQAWRSSSRLSANSAAGTSISASVFRSGDGRVTQSSLSHYAYKERCDSRLSSIQHGSQESLPLPLVPSLSGSSRPFDPSAHFGEPHLLHLQRAQQRQESAEDDTATAASSTGRRKYPPSTKSSSKFFAKLRRRSQSSLLSNSNGINNGSIGIHTGPASASGNSSKRASNEDYHSAQEAPVPPSPSSHSLRSQASSKASVPISHRSTNSGLWSSGWKALTHRGERRTSSRASVLSPGFDLIDATKLFSEHRLQQQKEQQQEPTSEQERQGGEEEQESLYSLPTTQNSRPGSLHTASMTVGSMDYIVPTHPPQQLRVKPMSSNGNGSGGLGDGNGHAHDNLAEYDPARFSSSTDSASPTAALPPAVAARLLGSAPNGNGSSGMGMVASFSEPPQQQNGDLRPRSTSIGGKHEQPPPNQPEQEILTDTADDSRDFSFDPHPTIVGRKRMGSKPPAREMGAQDTADLAAFLRSTGPPVGPSSPAIVPMSIDVRARSTSAGSDYVFLRDEPRGKRGFFTKARDAVATGLAKRPSSGSLRQVSEASAAANAKTLERERERDRERERGRTASGDLPAGGAGAGASSGSASPLGRGNAPSRSSSSSRSISSLARSNSVTGNFAQPSADIAARQAREIEFDAQLRSTELTKVVLPSGGSYYTNASSMSPTPGDRLPSSQVVSSAAASPNAKLHIAKRSGSLSVIGNRPAVPSNRAHSGSLAGESAPRPGILSNTSPETASNARNMQSPWIGALGEISSNSQDLFPEGFAPVRITSGGSSAHGTTAGRSVDGEGQQAMVTPSPEVALQKSPARRNPPRSGSANGPTTPDSGIVSIAEIRRRASVNQHSDPFGRQPSSLSASQMRRQPSNPLTVATPLAGVVQEGLPVLSPGQSTSTHSSPRGKLRDLDQGLVPPARSAPATQSSFAHSLAAEAVPPVPPTPFEYADLRGQTADQTRLPASSLAAAPSTTAVFTPEDFQAPTANRRSPRGHRQASLSSASGSGARGNGDSRISSDSSGSTNAVGATPAQVAPDSALGTSSGGLTLRRVNSISHMPPRAAAAKITSAPAPVDAEPAGAKLDGNSAAFMQDGAGFDLITQSIASSPTIHAAHEASTPTVATHPAQAPASSQEDRAAVSSAPVPTPRHPVSPQSSKAELLAAIHDAPRNYSKLSMYSSKTELWRALEATRAAAIMAENRHTARAGRHHKAMKKTLAMLESLVQPTSSSSTAGGSGSGSQATSPSLNRKASAGNLGRRSTSASMQDERIKKQIAELRQSLGSSAKRREKQNEARNAAAAAAAALAGRKHGNENLEAPLDDDSFELVSGSSASSVRRGSDIVDGLVQQRSEEVQRDPNVFDPLTHASAPTPPFSPLEPSFSHSPTATLSASNSFPFPDTAAAQPPLPQQQPTAPIASEAEPVTAASVSRARSISTSSQHSRAASQSENPYTAKASAAISEQDAALFAKFVSSALQ